MHIPTRPQFPSSSSVKRHSAQTYTTIARDLLDNLLASCRRNTPPVSIGVTLRLAVYVKVAFLLRFGPDGGQGPRLLRVESALRSVGDIR
jgi:hypothetical protein